MAHRFRVSLSLVAAALGSLAVQPLQAQQEAQRLPPRRGALQEVTVTATRRETSLQETPIAVTALSSEAIAASNPHDLGDLAKFAPGFSAARLTAFNAASFAIRGVGQTDIIVYQEAPVSVVVDDFVLPSTQTQLLDTFDLERVEILRGPQGTTFGKNTTGGAVNITTKRPSLTDSERAGPARRRQLRPQGRQARVQCAGGRWQVRHPLLGQVHQVGRLLPQRRHLGPDRHVRAAARHSPEMSGAGDGKRVGGDDVFYGRLKGLWQPVDNLSVLFQYENLRDRSDAVPSYNDTPPARRICGMRSASPVPTGDPLDHMASSGRDEFLIREGSGQRVDVDGFYANLDWARRQLQGVLGHRLSQAGGASAEYLHGRGARDG